MLFGFLKNRATQKMAARFFILKKAVPRSVLAMKHLRGEGIEIGALHNPVFLGPVAKARYVDRMSVADLVHEYPELRSLRLVEPEIIDDGEKLMKVPVFSQNFIIANHFIEHCEDPIRTFKNFIEKLRPNGILYLAVPDKRYTFDRDRASTPYEHLVKDHESGPESSRLEHFREWASCFHQEAEREQKALELIEKKYSIHFHVWTGPEFLNFLQQMIADYQLPLKVVETKAIGDEAVFVLSKI